MTALLWIGLGWLAGGVLAFGVIWCLCVIAAQADREAEQALRDRREARS